MTPERFQLVEDLYHSVLEKAPPERPRFLKESCGEDHELLRYVQSLIGTETEGRLKNLVASTAALETVEKLVGSRVGAYEIQSELGSGGMGDVYLATRADKSYLKKVAIKFVKSGWLSNIIQERFRAERQILANLDHPYIARLLDGGTSSDGRPYLVMEYVDGLCITEFADRNHLDLVQRVKLFRRICEAVQYAHQNLIVHRDLKPANIVITHEGTPKLLDFGVAKLLDSKAGQEQTQTQGWRMLTPDYASPEQFRGDLVTTASDVYSLGAVLYLLLSGKPAFAMAGKTPAETERMVSEQEPERPSLRNPALRGRLGRDLDTVVLKAMRKSPVERYGSVTGLSEDLEAALAGLPLKACNYTWFERSVRLARRNRMGVAAGAVVAASLLASTAVSLGFAARAQTERVRAEGQRSLADQAAQRAILQQARAEANEKEAELRRAEADRERQRADASFAMAERRNQDEHALASEVLFGINDSLKNLPGATAVRTQAITKSAEFLDRLAQDSRGHFKFQQDLARSYSRLAELTGNPIAPNQGDLAGALVLYEKSATIISHLLLSNPRDPVLRQQLAANHVEQLSVLAYLGRGREAEQEGYRAIEIFRGLVSQFPDSAAAINDLASTYVRMASASGSGLFPDRSNDAEHARLARLSFERLVALDPHAQAPRIGLANALGQVSSALLFSGDGKGALSASLEAQKIREQLRVESPGNRAVLESLMFGYGRLGDIVMRGLGTASEGVDYRRTLAYYRQARDLAFLLATKDTANQRAQLDLAIAAARVGDAYSSLGEDRDAIELLRESVGILETLLTADRGNRITQIYLLFSYPRLGIHLLRLNQPGPALAVYERTVQISQPLIDAGDLADTFVLPYSLAKAGLARDAVSRDAPMARKWCDEVVSLALRHISRQQTGDRAKLRSFANIARAAQVYEMLSLQGTELQRRSDRTKALDAYRKANEGWGGPAAAANASANRYDVEVMTDSFAAPARLAALVQ